MEARRKNGDDNEALEKGLAAIRAAILSSPINREMLLAVMHELETRDCRHVIFRSSTNSEDLPGFNGAGLYESCKVRLWEDRSRYLSASDWGHPDILTYVERAMKEVWASVWSLRGFCEREYFGIDSSHVAMALLVQPLIHFGDGYEVLANGVCLTCNPNNLNHRGVFINALPGATHRVTDSPGEKGPHPEQVFIMMGRVRGSRDYQLYTMSSLSPHKAIITRDFGSQIVDNVQDLHRRMLGQSIYAPDMRTALDVEFLLVAPKQNGVSNLERAEMVVLQARPYPVNREGALPEEYWKKTREFEAHR